MFRFSSVRGQQKIMVRHPEYALTTTEVLCHVFMLYGMWRLPSHAMCTLFPSFCHAWHLTMQTSFPLWHSRGYMLICLHLLLSLDQFDSSQIRLKYSFLPKLDSCHSVDGFETPFVLFLIYIIRLVSIVHATPQSCIHQPYLAWSSG